ncbi:hypothetical protein V6N13_032792 [Hibiscus sabdariffa]|uniref:Uncharacterized protein n=1 Tax=Hibiscus sabdariffa TaxID=183260 RepID=A0ABR2FC27_9ROSI
MAVKPTVVLRAFLVGGIAVFAKVGGAMKAAGGAKLGAAATAAMTVAASAAMSGSKPDQAVRLPSNIGVMSTPISVCESVMNPFAIVYHPSKPIIPALELSVMRATCFQCSVKPYF